MATADWYPDPGRAGRLRYWDGSAWTEHVSEGGGVASEPITGAPPAPPVATPAPGPPPEPDRPPPAPADGPRLAYPPTPLGRAGFGVAALGGVLAAATAGSTAVTQEPFGSIEVTGAGAWVGGIAAVLCVAAAVVRWPWARVAGVGVATFFAVFLSIAVISFRTSDELEPGVDVSLAGAGWLMLAGALLLFAGAALALLGLRAPVRGPEPEATPGEGKGVASMVLGILGMLLAQP